MTSCVEPTSVAIFGIEGKKAEDARAFKNKTQSNGQSKVTAPKDRRDWAEREKGEDKTHEP